MKQLDFNGLNNFLMGRCQALLSSWLPGGRVVGNEYKCGDISGSPGDSFSVNLSTGKWADFATGQRGGDLVSLYGAIRSLEPGDAYRALATEQGFVGGTPVPQITGQSESDIKPPPIGFPAPKMHHDRFGNPAETYEYKGPNGETLYHIAKYTFADGSKQFVPFSYSTKTNNWVKKAWPKPRPLFNLDKLSVDTNRPVMIVEGEKCVLAAEKISGSRYVVTTWPGGAQAWKQADWEPIKGRDVLLWPDNDQPGLGAMSQLAGVLVQHNKTVKMLDVTDMSDKFDVADSNFETIQELVAWAKPRAKLIMPPPPVVQPAVRPEVLPAERDERDVTVQEAALDGYGSLTVLYAELGLQTTNKGAVPVCNLSNALILLGGFSEFKNQFWYDKFHNKYFTTWNESEPVVFTEVIAAKLQAHLQRAFGLRSLSIKMVEHAVLVMASRHIRSEPNEWLDSLPPWDGESRLETSFFVHFGVLPSAYQEAVSKNFYLSMVARILKPGCKVDTMVVFEGSQGAFKSTALSIIGGKFYTQNHEPVSSKDFKMVMQGSMVIEVAEMESLSRADITKTKAILSDASDNFRIPYGRTAEKFPRQSIFVGTTNADSYLADETGARRFWPVRIGKIDLGLLTKEREQLFAEAKHRVEQGESWWEVPLDEAKAEQDARYTGDPWDDDIERYANQMTLEGRRNVIDIMELAVQLFDFDRGEVTQVEARRIAKILKRLGFRNQTVVIEGARRKRWVRDKE